jgi:tetratricopeptide (TPR) repeat protein
MSAQATLADTPVWPYLAAAAVLTDFAADKLRPMGGGESDIVQVGNMLLDHAEPIRAGPAKGRWSLSGGSRSSALSELKRRGSLQDAVEANRGDAHPDNPTQRAIDDMIARNGAVRIQSQSLPELLGYERAVELLGSAIETPAPLRAQLISRIERLRLLEPLQRLVEHGFAGRAKELEALRSYVDELESKSFKELLSRTLDNVLDLFRERPPLVIWGPGGVGKSTLIAKFLVDHAGAHQAKPTPFVYLDFDSGRVDPMEPDTLVAEALRQIQVQFPEFADKADHLSADAQTRFAYADNKNITRSGQLQQSRQLRSRFADLMRVIGEANDSKVLLFIDTFEVVQRRGITAVFNVIQLAAQLVQATPRVRPVIAGRVPIREEDFKSFAKNPPKWQPLPLEGFDPASGRAFLQARLKALRVTEVTPGTLDRIVALAGGNPLSLRLAAQVFASEGFGALEDAAEQAKFESSFTQERLQGFLHNRIIASLEAPLDRLADPGLVVRRITPEIIFRVLAKPCGLQLTKLEQAEELFQKLGPEVSLFEALDAETLRHRPDVRLLMLPILRARMKDEARAIDEAAAEYWSGKDDAYARAEQIYHLIWLDRDTSELDAVCAHGKVSKSLLEEALDELEALDRFAEARVWLCTALERDIAPELESKAGLAAWERHTERRARSLLQSAAAAEALNALRARPDRSSASPLWFLEVQALKLLDRDGEALQVVDRALERARAGAAPSHVLRLLIEKAWLFQRSPDVKAAFDCATQASELARSIADDALTFEATLLLTRSARRARSDALGRLREELARMLDLEDVATLLAAEPTLIAEATAEIGDLRPELFIMTAERHGSGGSDAAAEAESLIAAGVAYAERGDLDKAVEVLERTRKLSYRVDDVLVRARALLQLASVYYQQGRHDVAAERAMEAKDLGELHQNEELQLRAWQALGSVHATSGQYADALPPLERALALARSAGNPRQVAGILSALASVHIALGALEQALRCADESLAIMREIGDAAGERRTLSVRAIALRRLEQPDAALEALERALSLAQDAGDASDQVSILNLLAELFLDRKAWARAEAVLDRALGIAGQTGNASAMLTTLAIMGRLYLETDRRDDALRAYQQQFDTATLLKNETAIADARNNLARMRSHADEDEVRQALESAETIAPPTESTHEAPALDFFQEVSNARSEELLRSMESAQGTTEDLIQQTLNKSS